MELIEMPETSGNTLPGLCAGKAVLLIGIGDQDEVMAAAAAARSMVICPDTGSGGFEAERRFIAEVYRRLVDENLADKILVTRVSPLGVVSSFAPGQFEVAVLDPGAAGVYDDVELLRALMDMAPTVVVIADGDPLMHGVVANARAGRVGIAVTDGRFVIARSSTRLENGVY